MEAKTTEKVVTRFAPSPTGFMHVGGVRTALFAWLWARKNAGDFILRIEDTDKEREVEGSTEHIIESLKWLGLGFDFGPGKSGPNDPYIQSGRLEIYKKYANILIEKGLAYPDPYTSEEVESFRKTAEENKKPFLYREHRPEKFEVWDPSPSSGGATKPLRFKTPEIKSYKWHDIVQGDLSAGPEALDDFILIKNDGFPTYNFAHIVDDIEMKVTHVIRGQEFIASVPKFLSVYEAFGHTPPAFVTVPPILSDSGNKKLSKRDGAKDILDYKKEGYLPEAMVNYLAFLGFNPGGEREIFTPKELVEIFDLTKIQRSGARWSDEKLDWMNKEHIKLLSREEIEKNILEWIPDELKNKDNTKIVPLLLERISKWSDVLKIIQSGEMDFFYKPPQINKAKLIYKNTSAEKISENIKQAIAALENISDSNFNLENIKDKLMSLANSMESRGELLHPVRYALSGQEKSPDPFIIASILGKNETISRLQKAI